MTTEVLNEADVICCTALGSMNPELDVSLFSL